MSADFRAELQALLDVVDRLTSHGESPANPGSRLILTVDVEDLIEMAARARAALADEERQKGADAWPEPITDRAPQKVDADSYHQVQYMDKSGAWKLGDLHWVQRMGMPWRHTPRWRPEPPTLREQALAAWERWNTGELRHGDMALIRQALEEAGDER